MGALVCITFRRPEAVPAPIEAPDPVLSVALARLDVATRLRDEAAAARVLDGLAAHEEGTAAGWLARQVAAAGLRRLAGAVAHHP